MISRMVDLLLGWAMTWALWLLYPFLRSRTGWANPRVRHIQGEVGYALHSERLAGPNIRRWRKDRSDLFPATLQVQTVNRCNASCPMCPYPYTIHLQPREVMDDALFSKIAAECAASPELLNFVPMCQNEPLLDRKLEARIAEFKAQANPRQMVEIVTNGSLLGAERFRRLVAGGVDLITISVNANSAETYAKVMTGLSWRRLMQNLDAICSGDTSRVNLFLRFIKQRDNIAELRGFLKEWRGRGFNIFAYEMNNRSGVVRNFHLLALPRSFLLRSVRRAMGRKLNGLCPHAFSIAHVLQNGDIPLCTNDWHNREVLGNVRTQTIREIFNAPRAREIRELMGQRRYCEIDVCRDCSFWKEWF